MPSFFLSPLCNTSLTNLQDAVVLRVAADCAAAAGGGDLTVDELGGIGVGVRVGAV